MPKPLNSLNLTVTLTAETMVMTQSGVLFLMATMLEHVVTVVLKQAKDGPLAKDLDAGSVHEIMGVLALSHQERDALTFPLDDGTEKPLSIGHKEYAENTQDLFQLLPEKWCSHCGLDCGHKEGF